MKKNINVVVSFMYPSAMEYIKDFEKTIQKQTKTDFNIIIFNDHADLQSSNFRFKQELEIIPVEGTPVEIRFKALQFLKTSDFKKIYFLDPDDTMTSNRIENLEKILDTYNVVSNDLNLVDKHNKHINNNIWQNRLGAEYEFSSEFIIDKNIVGFGNTAINRDILDYLPEINVEPIAADWYIFYQLLRKSNETAFFTTKCQTNYRQHDNNIAGIQFNNKERLQRSLEIRTIHYRCLSQIGYTEIENELNRTSTLNIDKELTKNNKQELLPFWWEI